MATAKAWVSVVGLWQRVAGTGQSLVCRVAEQPVRKVAVVAMMNQRWKGIGEHRVRPGNQVVNTVMINPRWRYDKPAVAGRVDVIKLCGNR